MTVHSTKTDNHDAAKKIGLRRYATKDLPYLSVLDCFAGNNMLWQSGSFNLRRYYGIEKEKGKGRNLYADNLRVIGSLDLSPFNIIDLDSYGVPFNQCFELFRNPTLKKGTVIVYTSITGGMNAMNKACLKYFHMDKMYSRCKVLLNKKTTELFYAYLYENGIRKVYMYSVLGSSSLDKQYGFFIY